MSIWYKVLYQIGLTPWEEDPATSPAAEQVAALFDREENGREPTYGRALDLGCGSGIWSVELAKRGWQVTGVDVVRKAIFKARDRARTSGVEAEFVQGDITDLRAAGLEPGFQFILDFECFNHLNPTQRRAVGREVTSVAAPGATMLMLVWSQGRRWPLPPGASRREIEEAFPEWMVIDEEFYTATSALPWWLRNAGLRFYRLRRNPPDGTPRQDDEQVAVERSRESTSR